MPRTEGQKIWKRSSLADQGQKGEEVAEGGEFISDKDRQAVKRLRPSRKVDRLTTSRSTEYVGTRWEADMPRTRRKEPMKHRGRLEGDRPAAPSYGKRKNRRGGIAAARPLTTKSPARKTDLINHGNTKSFQEVPMTGSQGQVADSTTAKAPRFTFLTFGSQDKEHPIMSADSNQDSDAGGANKALAPETSASDSNRLGTPGPNGAEGLERNDAGQGAMAENRLSWPETDVPIHMDVASHTDIAAPAGSENRPFKLECRLSVVNAQETSKSSIPTNVINQKLSYDCSPRAVKPDDIFLADLLPGTQYSHDHSFHDQKVCPNRLESDRIEPRQNYLISAAKTIDCDDNDFLYGFLRRARARKDVAERATPSPIKQSAPQRSTTDPSPHPGPGQSRKALEPIDSNTTCPTKGTKPEVKMTSESEKAQAHKASAGSLSPEGSRMRTRFPRPQRKAVAAPTTIPVRQANSTELVLLQKTEAQQVALATRNNTKRNRGEAVMPKVKLQTLSQQQCSPTKSPRHKRNSKGVSWDERLAYLGREHKQIGLREKADVGHEEVKPKGKQMRRLGASNGTPAPKRVKPQRSDVDQATTKTKKEG